MNSLRSPFESRSAPFWSVFDPTLRARRRYPCFVPRRLEKDSPIVSIVVIFRAARDTGFDQLVVEPVRKKMALGKRGTENTLERL